MSQDDVSVAPLPILSSKEKEIEVDAPQSITIGQLRGLVADHFPMEQRDAHAQEQLDKIRTAMAPVLFRRPAHYPRDAATIRGIVAEVVGLLDEVDFDAYDALHPDTINWE